jgi:hypothetical protein
MLCFCVHVQDGAIEKGRLPHSDSRNYRVGVGKALSAAMDAASQCWRPWMLGRSAGVITGPCILERRFIWKRSPIGGFVKELEISIQGVSWKYSPRQDVSASGQVP